jgi:hypothetical protein
MNYQGVGSRKFSSNVTNAAPQHSLLNQGKQLWQGLKNYILNSAPTHGFKACAVTAPCTPTKESVRVSREFWKMVVMEDSERNKMHAIAYLLSQGQLIHKLLEDRNRSEAVEGFCARTLSHLPDRGCRSGDGHRLRLRCAERRRSAVENRSGA